MQMMGCKVSIRNNIIHVDERAFVKGAFTPLLTLMVTRTSVRFAIKYEMAKQRKRAEILKRVK